MTVRKRKQNRMNGRASTRQEHSSAAAVASLSAQQPGRPYVVLTAVLLGGSFLWAYWPTLVQLVHAWDSQPDYSHGFFVAPLAVYFLWARRERFPDLAPGLAWGGLVVILASMAFRYLAGKYYIEAVDGWSIILWVAGVVWLLAGWRVLAWAWPAIAFLVFMVPLPWRAEHMLSYPLQRIATKLSTWTLQCLGQPAIAEGNTIWLNETRLEIEQACSGLRIFVAIIALCFAYLILFHRPWWQRVLLVASIAPVALVANATRIVATGLLGQYVSGEAAHKFTHDVSGWVMIPFAAGLFALVLVYLDRLVREVEIVDMGAILRQAAD